MARAKTVLVVDDDPHIRGFLATVLEHEGYRVETATNGSEALTKARDLSPDAILLDLMMPLLDGAGFLREWRANATCSGVPVLLMSAWHARACSEAVGAQRVLLKPFDYHEMLTMLASILQRPPDAPVTSESSPDDLGRSERGYGAA
jgi:DNA-binding response OmpR family regulator